MYERLSNSHLALQNEERGQKKSQNFCEIINGWPLKVSFPWGPQTHFKLSHLKVGNFKSLISSKLMRSNRFLVRFRLKSDSNYNLIDFFNPKSSYYLIEIIATIRIRTRNSNPNLNMIENLSNLIKNFENDWIFNWFWLFQYKSTFSVFYWQFWAFNQLFQSFNQFIFIF